MCVYKLDFHYVHQIIVIIMINDAHRYMVVSTIITNDEDDDSNDKEYDDGDDNDYAADCVGDVDGWSSSPYNICNIALISVCSL